MAEETDKKMDKPMMPEGSERSVTDRMWSSARTQPSAAAQRPAATTPEIMCCPGCGHGPVRSGEFCPKCGFMS